MAEPLQRIPVGATPSSPRRLTPADRLAGLPTEGVAALVEASNQLGAGRFDDAQGALERVFALDAEHAEALRMQAVILSKRGRRDEAIASLRRALRRQPHDPLILNHLGALLHETGDAANGLILLRRACELDPALATAWLNLGRALTDESHVEEAAAAFERALACDPRNVPAHIAHGDMLKSLGRTADAAAAYRSAIRVQPDSTRAWFGLADLKTERLDKDEIAALERLYAEPKLDDGDRAFAGFALGKALEDETRYAEAFEVFSKANAIWRRRVQWNLPEFGALLDRFTDAFATPPAGAPDRTLGQEAVFIVSLPRSGSTLTEQILAAHPDVEGGGEVSDLVATIQAESQRRGEVFPNWVPQMTPEDWQRLGHDYLARTAHWRSGRKRFTDKALTNWLFLGAALAMLPGARFVNCRRDPVETCWSCYKQLFGRNPHPFSYTLEELGAYWQHYDRLMSFWHARYPGKVYDQVYEDLLADPETQVRRLLSFCDLDFDPSSLAFHKAKRTVRTASAAQVREPLRGDTARAHLYGTLLDPLRRSLGLS
ncbi:tetratricopeptide repeat-containing sulfotransferase family protein [Dokdonella sp.]|uniref:tetratricopeptide repeat-containing sulfotransferase family protein n=1 Tax=Dokdonella sp. TaxID=2291710 RepID=UPI001B1A9F0B|nr:tetratricopeptide repeat-containing sulfotransferase family protein [Dokdonella sp.]MBO9663339.1 sulfotransferase [Dokdonella sp.]